MTDKIHGSEGQQPQATNVPAAPAEPCCPQVVIPDMSKDEMIIFLWGITDDIDTYGDMAKSDDAAFRRMVEKRQKDRWKTGITTDGYVLTIPQQPHVVDELSRPFQAARGVMGTENQLQDNILRRAIESYVNLSGLVVKAYSERNAAYKEAQARYPGSPGQRSAFMNGIHFAVNAAEKQPNPSAAAIEFTLSLPSSDGVDFLRLWNEGEFETCRAEWPEAPKDCYIGADTLFKDAALRWSIKTVDHAQNETVVEGELNDALVRRIRRGIRGRSSEDARAYIIESIRALGNPFVVGVAEDILVSYLYFCPVEESFYAGATTCLSALLAKRFASFNRMQSTVLSHVDNANFVQEYSFEVDLRNNQQVTAEWIEVTDAAPLQNGVKQLPNNGGLFVGRNMRITFDGVVV